jgi:hypothetical protein
MAITCQKPTINYDVYQFKYTDYDETRGVITTQKKEDFINMLRKLACDEDFYKKTVDSLEQSSKEWGLLDGKSGNRLHGLIDKLSIT